MRLILEACMLRIKSKESKGEFAVFTLFTYVGNNYVVVLLLRHIQSATTVRDYQGCGRIRKACYLYEELVRVLAVLAILASSYTEE